VHLHLVQLLLPQASCLFQLHFPESLRLEELHQLSPRLLLQRLQAPLLLNVSFLLLEQLLCVHLGLVQILLPFVDCLLQQVLPAEL
jgi:hypothetical protein